MKKTMQFLGLIAGAYALNWLYAYFDRYPYKELNCKLEEKLVIERNRNRLTVDSQRYTFFRGNNVFMPCLPDKDSNTNNGETCYVTYSSTQPKARNYWAGGLQLCDTGCDGSVDRVSPDNAAGQGYPRHYIYREFDFDSNEELFSDADNKILDIYDSIQNLYSCINN